VAGVTIREATLKSFNALMAESMLVFATVLVLFAVVVMIAAVVYNSARVALSERERELGTLRVWIHTREISRILLGEIAIYTAIGIANGFLIGSGLCWFVSWGMENDIYRIPIVLDASTFSWTGSRSGCRNYRDWIVCRPSSRLDLVEVLKTKE